MLFVLFERVISKPLIDEADQGVDTTQTDGCFLVAQLFYSLGVAATTLSMNLSGMVAFVLLCVLLILLDIGVNFETVTLVLPVSLQKSQNRNNATSDVQKMQT